jgi:hypothetical protein
MARAIDLDKAIEIIEEKQKELCPVGRYGRNYVYGSDREKYDDWEEIIDALEHLSTLTPPNEPLTLEHLRASPHGKIKDSTLQSICNRANEIACRPPEGEA